MEEVIYCINQEELTTTLYPDHKTYTTILVDKYSYKLRNTFPTKRKKLDYSNHCINCYEETTKLHKSFIYKDYKVCDICHQKEIETMKKYGGIVWKD